MHPLEINAKKFGEWLDEIKTFSESFLRRLPEDWAYKNQEHLEISENPFRHPHELREVLQEFNSLLQAGGVNTASGRFLGYVPGGGVITGAIGDLLAALTNRFSGMFYTSPGAQKIEGDVIRWMCDLFGYPKDSWGVLTSGGTLANLHAVVTAREKIPFEQWPKSVIYLSSEGHVSLERALKVAGLAAVPTRKIPVDENFKWDLNAFENILREDARQGLKPWMLIANAGATNLGSIDPLAELGALAKKLGMWFHVDAAYGGFFIMTAAGKKRLKGIEFADSITLDPHKGLFQPYGCGALIVRERDKLRQAMNHSAYYLSETESPTELSQTDYSLELTRHFRALRVWLSLKIFGEKAISRTLEEKLELTALAVRELQNIPGIRVIVREPELTAVGFQAHSDELTLELHRELCRRGKVYLSTTRLRGRAVIRICILSFRTHKHDIELCLNEIRESLAAIS